MSVLSDVKILLNIGNVDTAQDASINLYIRKATTLISLYLNVPIVKIPNKFIYNPTEPMETINYPLTPSTISTNDGTYTTIESTNIEESYPDAIIEYVIICMNKRGNEGIKQFSEGSTSGTYGNELPESVKALLPMPFVTLKGVGRRFY